MNAERLLAIYDRVADAPDAVNQLRRFVLDLAVRGKLVEQDPNDEPGSELLKRIEVQSSRLLKEGKIRMSKALPNVGADEKFMALPEGWVWTRLGIIGDWGSGSTPSRGNTKNYGGKVTWLKSGELNDHLLPKGSEETITPYALTAGTFRKNQSGDVLIAMYGATIGKLAILAEPAVTNQAVCGCTPFKGVFNRFLFLFLLSQRTKLRSSSEGGAQPNISKTKIVRTPFPLAPLREQCRIVEKVDELMALCDQLERTRNEREQTRDRLTKSSYARLTTSDTDETFQVSARFVANALPALTARADQIKQLRQTILDLAVRGKLVEQDPADEPAAELLKRIAAEKALLKQETCDSRIKPAADPANEGYPGPLPDTWKVQSFENLFLFIDYRGRTPPKTGRGIPLITAKNIRFGNLNREPREFIAQETFETWMTRGFPQLGDLFFTTEAPLANVCLNDIQEPFALAQRVICLQPYGEISTRYIMFAIMSDVMQTLIGEHSTGLTAKGIKAAKLKPLPIPLPPLAEQHRIVVRVDELMALCDRLETSLAVSDATRARLLESLLHEALTPVAAVDDLAHASPASIPPVNAEVAAEPLSSA